MSEQDLLKLISTRGVADWRIALARWVESSGVQKFIIGVILLNGLILGLETSSSIMAKAGGVLILLDKLCLVVFVAELSVKFVAYRWSFWRNGWNWFDFLVVAIALVPGAGPWAVLRSLRILRVLRLLTVMPQLRKVVAAFVHAIPGLSGVIATFTILNLFIGIIVSTMQELSTLPDINKIPSDIDVTLNRIQEEVETLRTHLDRMKLN